MKPTRPASSRRVACVLSQGSQATLYLKELLRSIGWHLLKSTSSVAEAVGLLEARQAFLLIVDDDFDEPALIRVRQLQRYMAGLCSPLFIFLYSEHSEHGEPLARLGLNAIAKKPLTPSLFLPAFQTLVRQWEQPALRSLHEGLVRYLGDHDSSAWFALLLKVRNIAELAEFSVPVLALMLRQSQRLEEAEKLLIQSVKKEPQNLKVILSLGDLYTAHAMPEMARRLYLTAQKSMKNRHFLLAELAQIAMMQGNFEDALLILEELRRDGFMRDKVESMMARLYFSLGQVDKAAVLLAAKKGLWQKMLKSWSFVTPAQEAVPKGEV